MVIRVPEGNYLDTQIASMAAEGEVNWEKIQELKRRYRLDEPLLVQYVVWIANFVRGDMGESFEYQKPVTLLIGQRFLMTFAISLFSILFTWSIAIPVGIYCAVKKNSFGDYSLTFLGMIGLATPNFLLALVFQYLAFSFFGIAPSGLFSDAYLDAPWSLAKLWDLFAHIWIPVVIIGTEGTAGMIRVMRANLLDELGKQYVVCARARGIHPLKVLLKYPVRLAVNPIISTVGWLLPALISGSAIVSIVLNLETMGPLLLQSLMSQDTYLATSLVFASCILSVVGTLISDILLVIVDPRIQYEGQES